MKIGSEKLADAEVAASLAALERRASLYRAAQRSFIPDEIGYLILVPTLRCNLSCSYCQVSRVSETAIGFDWGEKELKAVKRFIASKASAKKLTIEFQGGEPLLALSALDEIRQFGLEHTENVEFIVCSNLQTLPKESFEFLSNNDVKISTSFDGTAALHRAQRMQSDDQMSAFLKNVEEVITRFGREKLSALPTLDPLNLPSAEEIVDGFVSLGLDSLFLRPIANYGFARKAHKAETLPDKWYDFYRKVVKEIIRRNYQGGSRLEEFYLTICLKRMLRSDFNNHVDLRNPNIFGSDYLVIDFDGTLYPTDEARMLTRTRQIDLSIGDVFGGIDQKKLSILNSAPSNFGDRFCDVCKHQSYCGRDPIDDLSRYARIDLPRNETEFCRRHTFMFGLIEEMLSSSDEATKHSLAIWLGIPNWDHFLGEILR